MRVLSVLWLLLPLTAFAENWSVVADVPSLHSKLAVDGDSFDTREDGGEWKARARYRVVKAEADPDVPFQATVGWTACSDGHGTVSVVADGKPQQDYRWDSKAAQTTEVDATAFSLCNLWARAIRDRANHR